MSVGVITSPEVVIGNVVLFDPAGTVTCAGTPAMAGLLEESATTAPEGGAGSARAMTPVTLAPTTTSFGSRSSEKTDGANGGSTCREAKLTTPAAAQTDTVRFCVTTCVANRKVT